MEVVSQGATTNGLSTPSPPPALDPQAVVQYLTEVLQVTLGASKADLEAPGSLLSKGKYSETVHRCTRFASESQLALYVQKDLLGTEEVNGTDESEGM
jgi:dynein heavy chain 1, cytosolic